MTSAQCPSRVALSVYAVSRGPSAGQSLGPRARARGGERAVAQTLTLTYGYAVTRSRGFACSSRTDRHRACARTRPAATLDEPRTDGVKKR